jgi:hypothetical protein
MIVAFRSRNLLTVTASALRMLEKKITRLKAAKSSYIEDFYFIRGWGCQDLKYIFNTALILC